MPTRTACRNCARIFFAARRGYGRLAFRSSRLRHSSQDRRGTAQGDRLMHVLVTGVAGFIGSTLARRLLERGDTVTGIDNLNDYYEVSLKQARLARLAPHERFTFIQMDIVDRPAVAELFAGHRFDAVMNLAAQAGVRYSIENPAAYIDANLVGFGNILEGCRHSKVGHLVYASSSSVYGANTKLPFSEAAQRRSSGLALRRHQEGERADGPHLRPPVRAAGQRAALLHRLRAMGAAGHGAVPVHRPAILAGQPIDGLQQRQHDPRLHLRRRHRRGDRAGDRPSGRARTRPGTATTRTRPRATRRTGSSTSATTGRSQLLRYIEVLEQSARA